MAVPERGRRKMSREGVFYATVANKGEYCRAKGGEDGDLCFARIPWWCNKKKNSETYLSRKTKGGATPLSSAQRYLPGKNHFPLPRSVSEKERLRAFFR